MENITIGVLAIQGAVEEHEICIKKLGCKTREIRMPSDIEGVSGIILPGGESTTMAIVGEKCGLFPELKKWVTENKPIWGTCAGMILLSDHAIKQANGGQSLVGGLDVNVCRNYFGSQIESCELEIEMDSSITSIISTESQQQNGSEDTNAEPFRAVFIRAPAILQAGSGVKVLGCVSATPHHSALQEIETLLGSHKEHNLTDLNSSLDGDSEDHHVAKKHRVHHSSSDGSYWVAEKCHRGNTEAGNASSLVSSQTARSEYRVAVAVKQGNILATAFHPELTNDLRWHRYFLTIIMDYWIDKKC